MTNLLCKYCKSSNVERRGTRERSGELYIRLKCKSCGKWSTTKLTYDKIPSFEKSEEDLNKFLNFNTFLITCAQNNTPLDKKAWEALNKYADYKKAKIIVIPIMYRNPTSPEELASKEAWWPPEVTPHLVQQDVKLGKGIRVIGDSRINATAVNPLTGFESLTGPDSAVFGHAQIQMKTVATPQNRLPKLLYTSGSVSRKNYSESKAGKKGDFHHSLGFVIVEIDRENNLFHIRNVVGDNDSEFYDVDCHITSRGVKKIKEVEALILGDEHHIYHCPDVRKATFEDKDSIVQTCRPKYLVRHDIVDSYSISHHHKKSPSTQFEKQFQKINSLQKELENTARYLENTTPDFSTNVVVPSNHHDHIKRWLEETDWKSELWNAKLYHDMWSAWLLAIENGDGDFFHPFIWWMRNNCKITSIYLQEDYPFIVKDIYLGFHGHKGSNGSRGNINNFSKIGAKTVIAHQHHPGIEKGCYMVGTSSKLRMKYNKGPSSWLNTHCIIHQNGKRQLINIIKGKWRLK